MKLERLMAITMILLNRRRIQAQELAERLEVSLRTIYRDLESLSLAGLPIVSYTGGEGGYEIMDSFKLEKQMLSLDELTAMFTALRGLQSVQAYQATDMERLLDKVGAMVAQAEAGQPGERSRLHLDFAPWKRSEAERVKYHSLNDAIKAHRVVSFAYVNAQGEESERRIEPVGLALKGYAWYVHGYCYSREEYRTFRISRIHKLQVLEETFSGRQTTLPSFNEKLQRHNIAERLAVVLRFEGNAKRYAMDHFEEGEIERQADGALLVRSTLPDTQWIIGILLQFRAELLIVEPPELAAKVRQEALAIAAQYDETGRLTGNK
jgi:predicted DNA-binding transcriptional regulator YafY